MLTTASLDIAILLKSAAARRRLRPHTGTGGTAPPGCSPSSLTPAMPRGGPARPVDDQAACPDRWIANPGPVRSVKHCAAAIGPTAIGPGVIGPGPIGPAGIGPAAIWPGDLASQVQARRDAARRDQAATSSDGSAIT